ncbi:MAG: PucR family transcriptional regulator [Jatrophihabitantaceae bacterium]
MTSSAEVQEAVDRLGDVLGCAVLVEDVRHSPLWWSAQGQVDGLRTRTILQREADPAALAVVARLGLARAQGPVRTPAVPEADMLARWCVPLRAGRDLLGYLWVLDPDESVSAARLPIVVACADLAASAIARARVTGEGRARRRASLLERLAVEPDEDAAHELIALEDLHPTVSVAVNLPGQRGGWDLRAGLSVHVDGRAAPATSGAPVPLRQLHVAVRRARVTAQALRAGAALAVPSWDFLGAWRLVVDAPDELAVAAVHPAADRLAAQHGPDLLLTARALLDHGGDVTGTAEQLHIHRTTLYYRLERIEALTGVNLRTGPDRVDLHMALRLAAYRRAAAP